MVAREINNLATETISAANSVKSIVSAFRGSIARMTETIEALAAKTEIGRYQAQIYINALKTILNSYKEITDILADIGSGAQIQAYATRRANSLMRELQQATENFAY